MSFLDTVYDTYQHSERYGSPKNLIGDGAPYNNLRYPLDIGSADKGHYMVIHVNQQTKTQFKSPVARGQLPTVISNIRDLQSRVGPTNLAGQVQQFSGVIRENYSSEISSIVNTVTDNFITKTSADWATKALPELSGGISGAVDGVTDAFTNLSGDSFVRTIERTTDSITFYMPDTLNFQYNQTYSDLALGGNLMSGIPAAVSSAISSYQQGGAKNVGKNLAPFLMQAAASNFGQIGQAAMAAGFGVVPNPMIELLYTQPNLRNFQFDFNLYPRDEREALEVQNILQRLRFHQAPEIKTNTGGFFLIPPSEFDIKFYYNGKINPNIDPISTCILEQIIINYAPAAPFVAYEVDGQNSPSLGGTGMPVAIQLTLMFKETQIMTKDNYRKRDRLNPTPGAVSFPIELKDVPVEPLNNFTGDGYNNEYGNYPSIED